MARKNKFAAMFTLRADGRYQGTYYDKNGVRRFVYDKDPEKLHQKILEKQEEKENLIPLTFLASRFIAEWTERRRFSVAG